MYTKIIELTTDKSTNIKVPLDTSYKKKNAASKKSIETNECICCDVAGA